MKFPLNFQTWIDVTFLHWRYPVEVVRPCVPPPLEIEAFDGSAWVGVIPFLIRDFRPALLPPLPWLSAFPETNCRTYVKAPDGSSGVWFFSLDAARAVAVAGARLAYGLRYAWARMRVVRTGGELLYQSARIWPANRAMSSIRINEGISMTAGELELYLTARFRLYSFVAGRLTFTRIEHPPWSLKTAELIAAHQTLTNAAGLPLPRGAPVVQFSPGVRVRVGRPELLRV